MLLTAQQAPPRPTLCYHEACAGYSSAVAWGRRVGNKRMPYGAGEVRLQTGGVLLVQGSALAFGYLAHLQEQLPSTCCPQIPPKLVHSEWTRGVRLACTICGQPGATVCCKGIREVRGWAAATQVAAHGLL